MNFPDTSLIVSTQDECGICLGFLLEPRALLKQLPCSHTFHCACLKEWFLRQPTCPTCRYDCRPGTHRGHEHLSVSPNSSGGGRPAPDRGSATRDENQGQSELRPSNGASHAQIDRRTGPRISLHGQPWRI